MNARQTALHLLRARSSDATVCPSEVARAMANTTETTSWRALMPAVHKAIDELLADGLVQLSWKGKLLDRRAGPYRFRERR